VLTLLIGGMVLWGLLILVAPMPQRGGPWAVLGAAIAVRLLCLCLPPLLSDDLFRYLWEGRVIGMGGNPFVHAPDDALWSQLADPFRARVNHGELPTIYPPGALGLFALIAQVAYSPLAIKAVMGLFDAGIAWALADTLHRRDQRLDGAWVYALHPLGAMEAAGSGHLEAAAVFALVMALRGRSMAWATWGALVKLLPGVMLLALGRRRPGALAVAALVGAASILPFADAGAGLLTSPKAYASRWAFNGGLFSLIEAATGEAARGLAAAMGALAVGFALWRHAHTPERVALWAGGAFVLLSPTVHPWYIAWAWVPALLCGQRAWTLLATLAPLSYAALLSYDPTHSTWTEPTWPRWVLYPPFFLALLGEWLWRQTQPGPWRPFTRRSWPSMGPSASPSPTPPAPSIQSPPYRP
jgi:hypothetical protein